MCLSTCGLVSTVFLLMAQFPAASSNGLYARQHDTPALEPNEGRTQILRNQIPDREGRRHPKKPPDLTPRLLDRTDDAKGIAISPDGKLLATGHTLYCARGEAKLWELESGRELVTLKAHGGMVKAVAFSPDGKTLAAIADSERWDTLPEVHLWDVATRTARHTLRGHTKRLAALAFSPDGRTLATGGEDGRVRLWEVSTGQPERTILANRGWVRSVAFSPTGRLLAIGGSAGPFNLRLWDTSENRGRTKLVPDDFWIHSVAFSPDGKAVAVAGETEHRGTIKLYGLATSRVFATLDLGQRGNLPIFPIVSVAFSPDGGYLAALGPERLKMWRTGVWEEIGIFHSDNLQMSGSLVISSDGRTLAVAPGSDRPVMIWKMAQWRQAM